MENPAFKKLFKDDEFSHNLLMKLNTSSQKGEYNNFFNEKNYNYKLFPTSIYYIPIYEGALALSKYLNGLANSGNILMVANGGNVGIGTTVAGAKLQVTAIHILMATSV